MGLQTISRVTCARDERRRAPRFSVSVPIDLRAEGQDVPMRMQTTDLSLTGCYVETLFPLEAGTRVAIVMSLDGQRVAAKGVVVTHHPQVGNGIEFVSWRDQDQDKCAAFLELIECQ